MSGIAIIEITALGAALVVLDQMEKAASIRLVEAELNDYYGFVLKIRGGVGELETAVEVAKRTAGSLQAKCVATVIQAPDDRAWRGIESNVEYNPLIEQNVVFVPLSGAAESRAVDGVPPMSVSAPFAIGLIETQGFTAVIEAIDTACKAANVEVMGKEKLGGGYITIVIKGDVAAVHAAIEAGKAKVPELGKLIAAHVIPRPSPAILSLISQAAVRA